MIPIPNKLLSFLGLIGDVLRKFKIKTDLSSSNMKALQISNYYSNQKSIEELGVQYQPIDKAIKDAVQYFIENPVKNKKPDPKSWFIQLSCDFLSYIFIGNNTGFAAVIGT